MKADQYHKKAGYLYRIINGFWFFNLESAQKYLIGTCKTIKIECMFRTQSI